MKHLLPLLMLPILASAQPASLQVANLTFKLDSEATATLKLGNNAIRITQLWQVNFIDHPPVNATTFTKEPWNGKITVKQEPNAIVIQGRSNGLDLDIIATKVGDALDFKVNIVKTKIHVSHVYLPHATEFPIEGMDKVVFPHRGSESMGLAFLPEFFRKHADGNTKWNQVMSGDKGYISLFGAPLQSLEDHTPILPLRVTEEGKKWYTEGLINDVERISYRVNRPPAEGQAELSLVENDSGSMLAGTRFGGKGWLFRFTGNGNDTPYDNGRHVMRYLFNATMNAILQREPELVTKKRIALASLKNGPLHGGWTPTPVADWENYFPGASFIREAEAEFVRLESPEAIRSALQDPNVGLILNPYGEIYPGGDASKLLDDLKLLKAFVQRGGIWWETGGFPFFYVLIPQPYESFSASYPSAVADFVHFAYGPSGLAIFGVQPLMRKPWDMERIVNPTSLDIAGLGHAANFTHGWMTAINPGSAWNSPPLRWQGNLSTPKAALAEVARVQEIKGSLEDKATKPGLLEKLKGAVLVRTGIATAEMQIEALERLPKGSIVHYTEYLKGGFDKQYPDHLPVNPRFGSDDDLATFIKACQDSGHLAMPYTNTSWWCIDPKGPTFEQAGEAPLAKNRDGSPRKERYGTNEGYSICFYHPAVQNAHRNVRKDMSEKYPNDIVLQDQVGSRSWLWNFNPLEPNFACGNDGMLSLSMEDAQNVPIATEDGYDRVLNFETMICGAAWGMIPAKAQHETRHAKYRFPQGEWEFFPILSYLGHDQCIFTTHDLGHFISTPDQVAAALAFGYAMSYYWHQNSHQNPPQVHWLNWLDALQKTICAQYAGKKLLDFTYPQTGSDHQKPHELIYTQFQGNVTIVANTGETNVPLKNLLANTAFTKEERDWLDTITLPPFGFYASAPNARAARIFDKEGTPVSIAVQLKNKNIDGVVLAPGATTLQIPVPDSWKSAQVNLMDSKYAAKSAFKGNLLEIILPKYQDDYEEMPVDYATKAPKTIKATKPVVAIVSPKDLKHPHLPADIDLWEKHLKHFLSEEGIDVIRISDLGELVRLLKLPPSPERPFAIVSPAGETVFGLPEIKPLDFIQMIKNYVNTGGIWWGTGGYPFFYYLAVRSDGSTIFTHLGGSGSSIFGITCPGGPVDQPKRPLTLTEEGKRWFSKQRAERLKYATANAQRPFLTPPETLVLVKGGKDNYVAPIRADGWGFLFNLGGFSVDKEVASDIIAGTIIFLWNNSWPQPPTPQRQVAWKLQ